MFVKNSVDNLGNSPLDIQSFGWNRLVFPHKPLFQFPYLFHDFRHLQLWFRFVLIIIDSNISFCSNFDQNNDINIDYLLIGVLIHRIFRGWSSGAVNFLHTTITLTSMIFLVIGIYAVFLTLNNMNCVHLYSVHSWLGLVSILSIITLWLSGIIIFLFPRFVYDIQLVLIPVHSFFGRITFTLVCGTAIIGFSDKLRITDRSVPNIQFKY